MSERALTVHVSQGRAVPHHDARDYTPPNAARVLEPKNVCVIRVDDEIAAFNDFFEPAISAYNAKQKRTDRKKSFDYHGELLERRAASKDPEHEARPFYEYVIGVGDRNSVMAVTDDTFDAKAWRRLKRGYVDDDGVEHAPDYAAADAYVTEHLNEHPDRERIKRALTAYARILPERFPAFRFVAIEGHDDEPNGTFHFHVRLFPVADGYKTGVKQRCGLTRALASMGYKGSDGVLPITQWQNDVKRDLEAVLDRCGYERAYGDGRKERLEISEYMLEQELADAHDEINQIRADARRLREQASRDAQAVMSDARKRAGVIIANADDYASQREQECYAHERDLEMLDHELTLRRRSVTDAENNVAAAVESMHEWSERKITDRIDNEFAEDMRQRYMRKKQRDMLDTVAGVQYANELSDSELGLD